MNHESKSYERHAELFQSFDGPCSVLTYCRYAPGSVFCNVQHSICIRGGYLIYSWKIYQWRSQRSNRQSWNPVLCRRLNESCKKEKADAAFVSLVSYLIWLAANSRWLSVAGLMAEGDTASALYGTGQTICLGYHVTDMGVFLGMILGVIVALVHNRFIDTEFKGAMAMYGNSKFVFIVLLPIVLVLALAAAYIWPVAAAAINALTGIMAGAGAFGVFLYGFLNRDALSVFKLLIGVSGIGPKGGLGILAQLTPDELRFAVMSKDIKAISAAPGIGKKTAEKLIVELKDKLKIEDVLDHQVEAANGAAEDTVNAQGLQADAVQALTALGYGSTEALQAVRKVEMDESTTVEDLLKGALKYLI